MRTTIKQTLFAPALLLLAAMLGVAGCAEDDTFGRLPEGSIPLEVGEVTVAGMKANTRAAISENAAGYTGIRKSRFVTGDKLELDLSNDGGITGLMVEATLSAEGAWVLNRKAYVIPGTTTIDAFYRAAQQGTDVWRTDNLRATTYTLTGNKVTLGMKHENAMIDITLPAGVTVTSISVAAHDGTADETLATAVEEETDGNHYRTIARPGTAATPCTVKSITAKIGGQSYVAILATPLTVEENKKYPIALTFKENKLTASVGTAALNWGDGGTTDIASAGYTRFIATPEDLAQFAKDVNDDAAGTGARSAIVLQTKDIDLSQLKPAAEAGANPLTGTAYTYTATADNWVTIGNSESLYFQGKYNGNGHTISNLKMTGEACSFFMYGFNVVLTGIHLRNFQGNVDKGGAALIYRLNDGVVSLCSATGTITSQNGASAGLIGQIRNSTVTRCSADVDISGNAISSGGVAGFAVQLYKNASSSNPAIIAGCSSTGNVAWSSYTNGWFPAGFVSEVTEDCSIIGCYNGGSMQDATELAFALTGTTTSIKSCYSAVTGQEFGNASGTRTDCAYAGTTSLTGVTGNVTPATAYAAVTASNASLADVKTLHWSPEEGYTLTEVTGTWYAGHLWKDNGTAAPTIDMAYEGTPLYNGQPANLLAIPGKTAYYIAPVNAKNTAGSETMLWTEAMVDGLCPDGWHVPTKDDFTAMTGHPADDKYYSDNNAAITAAFPPDGDYHYWSSDEKSSSSVSIWGLFSKSGMSGVGFLHKEYRHHLRCVRAK